MELPGVGNDAWVGRIDAVDIGEYLTCVRVQRGSQSNGRRIRSSSAERRNVEVR
jgi:hypothetical protein